MPAASPAVRANPPTQEILSNFVLRRYMITCSQCGIIKREVDHWFLAWTERGGERFCFALLESDLSIASEESVQTLCGERCLHKAVQRFSDSIALFCRPFYKGGRIVKTQKTNTNFESVNRPHQYWFRGSISRRAQKSVRESQTRRFEVKLPKVLECCLFDGSMVKAVYLSPRRDQRGTPSRF